MRHCSVCGAPATRTSPDGDLCGWCAKAREEWTGEPREGLLDPGLSQADVEEVSRYTQVLRQLSKETP